MIMDGNFWCIYPREKNYYTLGSVIYSRISKPTKSLENAKKKITQFNNKKILHSVNKFEKQVKKVLLLELLHAILTLMGMKKFIFLTRTHIVVKKDILID